MDDFNFYKEGRNRRLFRSLQEKEHNGAICAAAAKHLLYGTIISYNAKQAEHDAI